MRILIATVAIVGFASASVLTDDAQEFLLVKAFSEFKEKHSKSYSTATEEATRFNNFREFLERAVENNRKHKTNVFGITQFADLTQEEFETQYLTYRPPQTPLDLEVRMSDEAAPTGYDWREYGVLTDVKDQGNCGSCWAFSATETVESAWAIAGNSLTTFSPQQVVSCDTYDSGCGGGWPSNAFKYINDAGGMATEADYPYTSGTTGATGTCKSFSTSGGTVSNWYYAIPPCKSTDCSGQNELAMASKVASTQPMSIAVDASLWSAYIGGIFPASACSNSYFKQNHAVQAAGYTATYWIVRNSWGTSWGHEGYLMLEFGMNTCGLADTVTYVSV